jgi:hypothetical protein
MDKTKPSVLSQVVEMPRPLIPVAGITDQSKELPPLTGNRTDLDALSEASAAEKSKGATDFERIIMKTAPINEQLFSLSLGANLEAVIDGSGIKDGTFDVRRIVDGFSIRCTIKF